jgi:shikimate kinase
MSRGDAPVFLIGYRGTGKTTVARELASRLGYESVDADDIVEEAVGLSIAEIFAKSGEAGFRELESQAIEALVGKRRTVIGLGGGAVLREDNRLAIREAGGSVVWLTASVPTILVRLAADTTTASRRPNLTNSGGGEEVEALLAARTPLYRDCATLIVDTEGKSAADVAEEIATKLQLSLRS